MTWNTSNNYKKNILYFLNSSNNLSQDFSKFDLYYRDLIFITLNTKRIFLNPRKNLHFDLFAETTFFNINPRNICMTLCCSLFLNDPSS